LFTVGDPGLAGGVVCYDKGSYSDGWRYLEAATVDQGTNIAWWNGSNVPTGAIATGIGSGQANTVTIISVQGAGSYAASVCDALSLGGYDDWFLPSRDELNLIYLNKVAIGGFPPGSSGSAFYWSSTETSIVGAAGQDFNSEGIQYNAGKNNGTYVRALRAF
jgi:hypothetical protein